MIRKYWQSLCNQSFIDIYHTRDPHVGLVWSKTSVCYAGVDVELIICITAPAFSSSCIFHSRIFSPACSGPAFSGPPFSASPVYTRCCCRWCRLHCVCGNVFSCCFRGVTLSSQDLRCRCAVSCSNTTSELYFHSVSGIGIARNIACLADHKDLSRQFVVSFITTVTIHYSFSLPLQAQNSSP